MSGLSNGNPVRALLQEGLSGNIIVQIGVQAFANSAMYASVAAEAGSRVITADTNEGMHAAAADTV